MEREESAETDVADRIVLSYRSPAADADHERWPLDGNERIRDELRRAPFLGYLRKAHGGRVERGDEWEEFVGRGCGTAEDVVLRVEAVEGAHFGADTEVELVHRRDVLAA